MYDLRVETLAFASLSDLTYRIRERTLLDIPSLELASKGITVFMGANGAGKSVLLRLLHGLDEPSSGEVNLGIRRTEQSLVLQTPVLFRRSVEANLRFVLKARKLPTERIPDLLQQVHLADKAKNPARRLSGGERQRLAIAQALATQPKVLLLDEPSASLDPSSTLMIEDLLKEISRQGVRVVLVTHDAMQARRLASEVVFLSKGRVVEQTKADTFFDNPQTIDAQAYLSGRLVT